MWTFKRAKIKRQDWVDIVKETIEENKWFIPDDWVKPDQIDEENMFDFETKWIIITWLLIVCIVWWLISIASSYETPSEKIKRIQDEILIAQKENINIADIELLRLNARKDVVLKSLSVVMNDILIYENCKKLNQSWELPVDCNTITLSLQQKLNWKVNSNWKSQKFINLKSQWTTARTIELLNKHNLTKGTYETWVKYGKQYWIKPEVAIAIAKADSSLWNELKTTNNIGNVGNTDSWATRAFETIEDGIEWIYKTLTNKYLWNIYTVGYLSEGWRINIGAKSCTVSWEFCYASSKENWNINVINTLRLLYNDPLIDESFEIILPNAI